MRGESTQPRAATRNDVPEDAAAPSHIASFGRRASGMQSLIAKTASDGSDGSASSPSAVTSTVSSRGGAGIGGREGDGDETHLYRI